MNSSLSTLNPFAQSYVPIALRDASSENKDAAICTEHGFQKPSITDDSKLKAQNESTQYTQEANMKFPDDEFEMDLAYLQMSFPGMSDQSLMDVYTLNDTDLDASLEMLTQLESVEASDCLPDALDIGDVPETGPSGECSTTKTKNVVGESYSSYGSSNLAVRS